MQMRVGSDSESELRCWVCGYLMDSSCRVGWVAAGMQCFRVDDEVIEGEEWRAWGWGRSRCFDDQVGDEPVVPRPAGSPPCTYRFRARPFRLN